MINNRNHVIFYFLYTDWDTDQRKHLLKEVVKETSNWSDAVLVQQSVSLVLHLFTRFRKKIIGFILGKYKVKKIDDTTILFTPKILFHHSFWHHSIIFEKIDLFLYKYQFRKFIDKHFRDYYIVLWVFHNRLYPILGSIKHDFVVYDYQDNYDYLSDGTWSKEDAKLNELLISESNFIICSAKVMYERATKLNENSVYLTNGNDFKTLTESKVIYDLPNSVNNDKPIIGFLGNLRSWVDFELLSELIEELNSFQFLFIGKKNREIKKDFNRLLKFDNVNWIPYTEQKLVSSYLRKFCAGIIPFKINKVMDGVFPNKFYEYMALGIPVITTALPELRKYSDIIGFAENRRQFIDYCSDAVNGKFDIYKELYTNLAKENTWGKNAKLINTELTKLINI